MGYSNIQALRGRYMGTVRTTAAAGTPARGGVTEDSFGGAASQVGGKRFIWNRYNRVARALCVVDKSDSWTYTTATFRQVQAAIGNKVEYIVGWSLDIVKANTHGIVSSANTAGSQSSGVGLDSTSVNSAQLNGTTSIITTGGVGSTASSEYKGYPGVGYHALVWLEIAGASGTVTWYGDGGLAYIQSGLIAEIMA